MKKKLMLTGVIASTITASYALIIQFTKKMLYFPGTYFLVINVSFILAMLQL